MSRKKWVGDGVSSSYQREHGALLDTVRATKKSSTPVASGTTTEKGAADKDKATTNRNLGKKVILYAQPRHNLTRCGIHFRSTQMGQCNGWKRKIVAIGEDFHSQVGDGKVRTTPYKVRWQGYDKKDDTWSLRWKKKQQTISLTLRSILWCPWQDLPHQCGLSACFRWWLRNPASASDTPNRRIRVSLVFDMRCAQCQNEDLSSDIRTRPIYISIQTFHSLIELSCISARYSTQASSTTTGDQHTSTCRMSLLCTVCI